MPSGFFAENSKKGAHFVAHDPIDFELFRRTLAIIAGSSSVTGVAKCQKTGRLRGLKAPCAHIGARALALAGAVVPGSKAWENGKTAQVVTPRKRETVAVRSDGAQAAPAGVRALAFGAANSGQWNSVCQGVP
jgi:hypothetical protein